MDTEAARAQVEAALGKRLEWQAPATDEQLDPDKAGMQRYTFERDFLTRKPEQGTAA
jgi:hypothetical protein